MRRSLFITHFLRFTGDLLFGVVRAGSEQGICFRDPLKQARIVPDNLLHFLHPWRSDVSRGGHRDVFMPCPGNRSLAPDRRLKPKDNQAVTNVTEIHS